MERPSGLTLVLPPTTNGKRACVTGMKNDSVAIGIVGAG